MMKSMIHPLFLSGDVILGVRLLSARCMSKQKHQHIQKKTSSEKKLAKAFVDYKRVRVKGGHGGKGMMSFTSLPYKEWAGPDGGDGGNGGHLIFRADANMRSLGDLKSLYIAEDGENGRSRNCHGKNAPHITLKVPVGTLFKNDEGTLVADLNQESEVFIAARGGAGGHGNYFFLSNENRAPLVYEEGGRPEERLLHLELRVMAHAGLVGFPNVGKSTLLRAISRARPKVAAYPFTTLKPHVGMVEYEDHEQVAVADIPGLIKGAHLNYGLGFAFLRHIERCLCLLYVLDLSDPSPWEQLDALKFELEKYSEGLSARPHAIVGNKMDLPEAKDNLQLLRNKVNLPVYPISALNHTGIDCLCLHLRELYDKHKEKL